MHGILCDGRLGMLEQVVEARKLDWGRPLRAAWVEGGLGK